MNDRFAKLSADRPANVPDGRAPLDVRTTYERCMLAEADRDIARAEVDNLMRTCDGYQDRVDHLVFVGKRYAAALRAIIARADTDKPGTSKVQDMRKMAEEALRNE